MNREIFVTCAVTGSGDAQDKHPELPKTPEQIARASIEAAKAGAAIAHCHVRDPETGQPARDLALYREVADRVRSSGVDVVLNFTAGMGGDLVLGPGETPLPLDADGTDLIGPLARLEHVAECLPEICTLDCGSMNFGDGRYVMVNTPEQLRAGAKRIQSLGVRPELEVFDTGHLAFVNAMIREGLIDAPPLIQFCLGIPWGAPADLLTLQAMIANAPEGAIWSAFAISRNQMPFAAAAALLGGNVRVGLEDNLYLDRGVFASNAQLVERAISIVSNMGARVIGPEEVRAKLGLRERG